MFPPKSVSAPSANRSINSEVMNIFIVATLLHAFFVCSVGAFAIGSPSHNNEGVGRLPNESTDQKNKVHPNFHVVAERLGKTVLRPGGSKASKKLQEMANIQPGDTVLELASGLGRSGIEVSQRYGAKVTLSDIDVSRLEKASTLASKLGLSNLIECKEVDMFDISGSLGIEAKCKSEKFIG